MKKKKQRLSKRVVKDIILLIAFLSGSVQQKKIITCTGLHHTAVIRYFNELKRDKYLKEIVGLDAREKIYLLDFDSPTFTYLINIGLFGRLSIETSSVSKRTQKEQQDIITRFNKLSRSAEKIATTSFFQGFLRGFTLSNSITNVYVNELIQPYLNGKKIERFELLGDTFTHLFFRAINDGFLSLEPQSFRKYCERYNKEIRKVDVEKKIPEVLFVPEKEILFFEDFLSEYRWLREKMLTQVYDNMIGSVIHHYYPK